MAEQVKVETVATIYRDGCAPIQTTIQGRVVWAVLSLIRAGDVGCTPIDRPAPRWSAYAHKARTKHGIKIETIHEGHDGAFRGTHARYVLRDRVSVDVPMLADYLASPEGRREFPDTSFLTDTARAAA